MTANDEPGGQAIAPQTTPVTTIDLKGVAAFAGLVELLAKELGTTAGQIQGNLPNGPSFNELIGQIDMNNQGYLRRLTLLSRPNTPLTLQVQSIWGAGSTKSDPQTPLMGGVSADYYLGATVEQIMPQGRALARNIEDIFVVLDRMVTLGQSGKLAKLSISAADLQAFETAEGQNLVRNATPKNSNSL